MEDTSLCDGISQISKGLYMTVKDVIGPDSIVQLRRCQCRIEETFINCIDSNKGKFITSGSRAEGFDFNSSDFDNMVVVKDISVCDMFIHVPSTVQTVVHMDTEHVSPGFALVRCSRYDSSNTGLTKTLEMRGERAYVSSKLWRESFLLPNTSSHGPCLSLTMFSFEVDLAYALMCPVWPASAAAFVSRSLDRKWPSKEILIDICKDGCLLVPINCKMQQTSDMMDLEWRISFSLAEKKLVHSMTHSQFLCYGLAKIFLNECLKKILPHEDVLCSYFMKTAVFWEISENGNDLSPLNFLPNFWNVFRRLLNWVSKGYCPNFFIPENNMFYGKICGELQRIVLSRLRDLYMEGYWSLLYCTSLNATLSEFIKQPDITAIVSCDEKGYELLTEYKKIGILTYIFDLPILHTTDINAVIRTLFHTLRLSPESEFEIIAQRLRINNILQYYAESLFLTSQSPFLNNKMAYTYLRSAREFLHRARSHFCMNYFILIKQMYMSGNYHKTIDLIHYIKCKLLSRPFVYVWNLNKYILSTMIKSSFERMIKSYIVANIDMFIHREGNIVIDELMLESYAGWISLCPMISIPPIVFLYFLLFLSYDRLGERHRRREILDELHNIVHHDDGYHIPIRFTAISWEILGICQQICDDHNGALESYHLALVHKSNHFKQATNIRMCFSQLLNF